MSGIGFAGGAHGPPHTPHAADEPAARTAPGTARHPEEFVLQVLSAAGPKDASPTCEAAPQDRSRWTAELTGSVGALLSVIGSGVAELVDSAGDDPELRARLVRLQRHTESASGALRAAVQHGHGPEGSLTRGTDIVTPREYDVLRLVAEGHTNAEIGARLGLSNNTVKSYLGQVRQKLQARNRAQLVTIARQRGLLG